MAKQQSRMAAEAEQDKEALLKARNYVMSADAWDQVEGEEFGGKSDILIIEVGEVVGPFEYVGHQQMTTELGETTVHLATKEDGETIRLPIQATFLRAIDQAGVKRGDKFIIKRFEDQTKKRGKGAGNPMAIYGVKVTERGVPATA